MARGPAQIWQPDDIRRAYQAAPPVVRTRVAGLLDEAVSSGRFTSIRTQGPAFGILTRDLVRVLSIRERRVAERLGKVTYYPRKVIGGTGDENRTQFDSALRDVGFHPPLSVKLPGHVELGYLSEMDQPAYEGLLEIVQMLGPLPSIDLAEPAPAARRTVVATRIVRDSALVRQLKARYDHTCQLCGDRLTNPAGDWMYSEGHHLRPLGTPHNGSDTVDNILVVCPNHHAMLDFAAITLSVSDIRLSRHAVSTSSIAYHNRLVAKRGSP